MDVGAYLRSARERRGLTREQVANATKLSPLVLRSIEGSEWDRLPGGLLTRGHLRAYALAVGVSPEDVVDEYLAQLPPPPIQEPPPQAPLPRGFRIATPLVMALAAVVLFGIYSSLRSPAAPPTSRSESVEELPAREPSAMDQAPEAALATTVDPQGLSLAIDPKGPCWVSATADGRLVVYRLLGEGETVTVTADEELVLRVGDAGAFSYTLNGLPGRPLGEGGQPLTITITRHNVQTFVSGSARVQSPAGDQRVQ